MKNKTDQFSRVDATQARIAARAIPHAFVMSESKEGDAFWRRIIRRLEEIARKDSQASI